ncbi:MAG: hypothetical protein DVB23_000398 [Verrucomicrobia bacterium]|jgi:hypothetical protein|nr:MAG: hypothetical protein DVB23_000398 [Verrucomicrobiota bacterium]
MNPSLATLFLLCASLPLGNALGQAAPPTLLNAPLPTARPASAPTAPQPPVPPHTAPIGVPRKFTLADFKAQVPVSPEGHFLLTVPQICHTTSDPQVREILTGRTVQTLAEVMPEPVGDSPEPRLRISRKLLHCCASHATRYSLPLDFGKLPSPPKPATWAKITGTIHYRREGLELVPVLQVATFEEAPPPPQPVLN